MTHSAPIALFVYNRPYHTRKSFAAIRAERPSRLLIIADGPRPGYPSDNKNCQEVREILENIDWPCEIDRNYADKNLGLKARVSSGLDWVFQQVDRAIILEDDCVPHPDFFTFCTNLLDYYESDDRVSVITGNNFQNNKQRGNASYYFSKYNNCWGWATWSRAWQLYQGDIPFWPDWQKSKAWKKLLPDRLERKYWSSIFDQVKREEIDSWAYPWTASVWFSGGLTATPNVNLVSNIGFGAESTHCRDPDSHLANIATHAMGKISHPEFVTQDIRADKFLFDHRYGGANFRLKNRIFRLLRKVLQQSIQKFKFRIKYYIQ